MANSRPLTKSKLTAIMVAVNLLLLGVSFSGEASEYQSQSAQYLGLGLSRLSVNSKHPSIKDQSITGVSLLYGLQSHNHVFELSIAGGSGIDVGPTPDIYYPEDSADFSSITLSYQYQLRDLRLTQNVFPYLGLGYSINSFNWDTYVYDHSGDGLTMIAGLAFHLEKNWAVNCTFRRYSFSGKRLFFTEGDYPAYDTEVSEVAVILEYLFL